MKALSALTGNHLEVIEANDAEALQRPVFAHFRVGQNRDPLSKCQAFARVLESGVGERVDVAFFKLCYVDITANTDIGTVFLNYQRTMASLGERYPKIVFLHVTVPLIRVGGGALHWLREKAGCVNREREDQARRHAYNQLLRGAYGSVGRLFDLAEVEATYPDGRPSCFQYHGDRVPTLVPEYTEDGGHLNHAAAERAARRLLSCLTAVQRCQST
ncbi:MAG: hypothetical protein Q8L74_08320 [Nitrospirota bacterium]|nr:hypothetical protein [Nitrospirota bacterium]MDP2382715.1 hypothetical protein [Nitrospirota bacterium]MDP3595585.1 hypothetical protein [Nitrospirota bacterium]